MYIKMFCQVSRNVDQFVSVILVINMAIMSSLLVELLMHLRHQDSSVSLVADMLGNKDYYVSPLI